MTLKWRKVGTARPELGNLINAACFGGEITILQIGKKDKAAIVPLSMVPEYQALMDKVPVYDDPMGEGMPRYSSEPQPGIPHQVTEKAAHSHHGIDMNDEDAVRAALAELGVDLDEAEHEGDQ